MRDRVLWKMTDEDFDAVIGTHLRGTFTCARAAAIRMRAQASPVTRAAEASIVVGSPAGQFGNFGQTNYAAAKAGMVAFARTWALELARSDITVNAIVPTALDADDGEHPDLRAARGASRGRRGLSRPRFAGTTRSACPRKCAPLVVFLASEAAAGVTGQAIGIGGDRRALYSHPAERVAELRDGGWTAEEIAARWDEAFAPIAAALRRQAPGAGAVVSIHVGSLAAIDVHVHAERNEGEEQDPVTGEILAAAASYFGGHAAAAHRPGGRRLLPRAQHGRRPLQRRRRGRDGAAAARQRRGAGGSAGQPGRACPVRRRSTRTRASSAVREARELIERGVRGFKFHPNITGVLAQRPRVVPALRGDRRGGADRAVPLGTTGIGAGMPGGGGVQLKYSNPMLVDDVAADFPELDIILAHPSFPWQEEALAIAVHKPNVYIDLSGWSPKYFPEILVRYTNTLLKEKMLFGWTTR